jgi:hypothetical protein
MIYFETIKSSFILYAVWLLADVLTHIVTFPLLTICI